MTPSAASSFTNRGMPIRQRRFRDLTGRTCSAIQVLSQPAYASSEGTHGAPTPIASCLCHWAARSDPQGYHRNGKEFFDYHARLLWSVPLLCGLVSMGPSAQLVPGMGLIV